MEEKKIDLYLDMDGTVFNTQKCIVDLYNEDFHDYKNFVKIDWHDVTTWDFKELTLANEYHINTYFSQKRFFDKVEMMDYFEQVMERFIKDERLKIHFVSFGYYSNLLLKEKWVKNHYPTADFIGVGINEYKDKSHIDMHDGIFVDDSYNNLITSNAAYKICYGNVYDWNKEWGEARVVNWFDLLSLINHYLL